MKLINKFKKPDGEKTRQAVRDFFKTKAFRAGGYSLAAAAVVIAIAILANMAVGALPASWTNIDMSGTGIYSISGQTQQIVSSLESPVQVYWLVQQGEEDVAIEQMLGLYEGLSEELTIEKIDPVVYPNFASEYTDETVYNNSLIVVGEDRSRYLSYYDIYTSDYSNYYTTGQISYEFAGEEELTSAIDYVVNDDLPVVYTLTGHGEASLPTSLSDGMDGDNILTEELSLLTEESVPSDADALLIYSPQSDISEDERDKILSYLEEGGRLLMVTDYVEEGLPNLMEVMEYYGASPVDGIVIEGDSSYYVQGLSYYLLPEVNYHEVTAPIYNEGYYILMPIAQGIEVTEEPRDGLEITELFTTSEDAYSKVDGYNLTTYSKEDGDIDGPFALGVAISESVDEDTETKIVWLGTSVMFDDSADAIVSGANGDMFLNALGWMCEREETISIRAKSLDSGYLTVSSQEASLWSFILIGIVPMGFIAQGIYTSVKRRRQ